jgi:hypothetical protein
VRARSQPQGAPARAGQLAHAALIFSSTYTRASQTNRVEGAKRRKQPPPPGRSRLVIRASTTPAIQQTALLGGPEFFFNRVGRSCIGRSLLPAPTGYFFIKKNASKDRSAHGRWDSKWSPTTRVRHRQRAAIGSPGDREVQNVQLGVVCSWKLLGVAKSV